jgi:hypothetical protein
MGKGVETMAHEKDLPQESVLSSPCEAVAKINLQYHINLHEAYLQWKAAPSAAIMCRLLASVVQTSGILLCSRTPYVNSLQLCNPELLVYNSSYTESIIDIKNN